jgi:predicted Zn finger-like uncharacterized protein
MKIVCDACQAKYSIADEKIQGKAFKIRCKKCNHIIVVKTGGEGAAAASAAPAAAPAEKSKSTGAPAPADQGAWHVVVDGEQVGPLTDAEVKDRLRQGKINSDTLVWKEGFADWMQLSTVPELTAILARITRQPATKAAARESVAREPARASNSMRAVAEPASSFASESDPFAAPTVITPAGTADLFASATAPSAVPTPVAPAPSSPFLFGGMSAPSAEPVAAKAQGNGAGSTHLTGQRNENSVLFSLSNLEALAVPSHSAGIRSPSGSSNTEGSGLIDIRSMAAMTLNDGGHSDMHRGSDALPTFSTPQFSPVAPVLLPMSTSGPPKWVYPVLGLLAVGILVLGYGIYKVAAAPPPGQPVVVVAPPPPPPAAPQPAAPNPAAAPTAEAAKPAAPEAKPSEAKPSVEEKAPDKGKGDKGKGDKGHRKSSETASSKGSGDSKKGSESASTTSPSDSSSTKPSGKKGSKSLDDLLGEVGNKKGGEDPLKPAPAAVKLITLTQSDIVNAMKGVQPKVQACANQFKVPGTAMATISVASGGRVNSATVTGKFAGTPTGSCVEAAAKSAKFPPCQSMTFPWPFTLSPR